MRYLLRRLGFLAFTAWAALTINFVLPRMMPGNPAQVMIAKFQGRLSPRALEALELAFGLNVRQSLVAQYVEYWKQIFRGDLGVSLTYYPTPVAEVLAQALPWTLGLVGVSTLLAFGAGTLIGIHSAWRHGSRLADAVVPVALFLNSMPYFWFALVVLYVFAFLLGWFPLGGGSSPGGGEGWAYWAGVVRHAVLPALTITVTAMGGWLLTMRNNMMSVLGEEYIAFARAKGLRDRAIKYRYAARNAILPSFTGLSMALGFVVGGALLTEMVFAYPGVGFILYQAVTSLDYPLMQAIFLFISLAVLLANFLADMTLALLDPRVRAGGG
ncbi:ABC transporter permease [Carboxydochorda subterranea]|uniref:ABC transporter permease n=1 Tax=Carboxydichorda subterranea TaxID=3109565 RepID=A0ABZ1BZ82_9FIRM|nr:ABC transporter permease [Limnochorda sp. L945t]WRP18145.1 ABC transporter permease [Limnochorda sp. L945t]